LKSTETFRQTATTRNATRIFSNFGSLKSTETFSYLLFDIDDYHISNFGSLKSTETQTRPSSARLVAGFSNFGSLKSTETRQYGFEGTVPGLLQQFRLVEEH